MTDDLVKRLRDFGWRDNETGKMIVCRLTLEAAAEIERLRAENLTLRNSGVTLLDRAERAEAELASRNQALARADADIARVKAERDALRELIADIEPYWKANMLGKIWDAQTAGFMASIRGRIDAARGKQ